MHAPPHMQTYPLKFLSYSWIFWSVNDQYSFTLCEIRWKEKQGEPESAFIWTFPCECVDNYSRQARNSHSFSHLCVCGWWLASVISFSYSLFPLSPATISLVVSSPIMCYKTSFSRNPGHLTGLTLSVAIPFYSWVCIFLKECSRTPAPGLIILPSIHVQ